MWRFVSTSSTVAFVFFQVNYSYDFHLFPSLLSSQCSLKSSQVPLWHFFISFIFSISTAPAIHFFQCSDSYSVTKSPMDLDDILTKNYKVNMKKTNATLLHVLIFTYIQGKKMVERNSSQLWKYWLFKSGGKSVNCRSSWHERIWMLRCYIHPLYLQSATHRTWWTQGLQFVNYVLPLAVVAKLGHIIFIAHMVFHVQVIEIVNKHDCTRKKKFNKVYRTVQELGIQAFTEQSLQNL